MANLTSIVITPPSPEIVNGQSQQFIATGIYSNGTSADLTGTVLWASSDPTVASIDASGRATGLTDGTTTISADLSGTSGSTSLMVAELALVSLALFPSTLALEVGQTQQFGAIGTYTDNSQQDITAEVTWSSSDAATAAIDPYGFVHALAGGASDIRATSGLLTGSARLTVVATEPAPGPAPPAGTPADYLRQAQQAMFSLLLGQQPSRVATPQLGEVEFAATTPAQLQRVIDYLQGLVQAGNAWPPDGSSGSMTAGYTRGRKPFSFLGWP